MAEVPYPTGASEPTVTYTLREVIDQMNRKLDILPGLVVDSRDHETRLSKMEGEVEVLMKDHDKDLGIAGFKDKVFVKFVGLATIMGLVAGGTFQVIQLVS